MSEEEQKAMENDILFKIDMELYDKFNDKFCAMNEYLGEIYFYADLKDLEDSRNATEINLLRQAIVKQQKEIEELKENNKENIKCIEEWINGERMSIHCIHKDSIRAKIEGLEEEKKIRPEFLFSVSRFIMQGKIQGYKELLEDKNNE